jgi:hypothetical protein
VGAGSLWLEISPSASMILKNWASFFSNNFKEK